MSNVHERIYEEWKLGKTDLYGKVTGQIKFRLSGAPNDRFLGNDLKWLVMHPGVL